MAKVNPRARNTPERAANRFGSGGAAVATLSDSEIDTCLEGRNRRHDDDLGSAVDRVPAPETLDSLLRSAARSRSGGFLDAEEALQESWLAFLTLVAAHHSGQVPCDVPSWITVAVRNHLADLERRARRRATESLAVEDADTRIGREEDPAIVYERRRRQREVRAAFEEASHQVSASSYRIIVLHLLEGCEYDEIAESLGMPVVRVRDQHRRAYRVLRDLLIGRFGSDPSGPLILQRKKSLASTRSIVIVEVRS